jgi:hypothetical protein
MLLLRRFEAQLAGALKMQLKRTGHPAKAAVAFFNGLVHLRTGDLNFSLCTLAFRQKH